jgi:hypothetical protein
MNTKFRFRDYALPLALILSALMLLMRPSQNTPHQRAHTSCTTSQSSSLPL